MAGEPARRFYSRAQEIFFPETQGLRGQRTRISPLPGQIERMLKVMTPTLEYLSSLRQEIADLKLLNDKVPSTQKRSPLDRSEFEARASRLLEIKQELGKFMSKPDNSVWW